MMEKSSRAEQMDDEERDRDRRASGQPHLRERELAARWQTSQRTIQRWRAEGSGPAFILIGGTIRYRIADVLDYEERMRRGGG